MAAIELDTFLRQPPKAVWRALTDPKLLARWLMPNDFDPELGRHFTFDRGEALGEARSIDCQVLTLEPDRELSFSWLGRRGPGDEPFPTRVVFRLIPEGHGTRLFFTHDGFDATDPLQSEAVRMMGRGWKSMITSAFQQVLDEVAAG